MTENLGYAQGTTLSSAKTLGTLLAGGVPSGANRALIQAESQDVRWRDDGGTPTASVGMLLANGDILEYDGDLKLPKFIEVTTSAKLNVTFYKV